MINCLQFYQIAVLAKLHSLNLEIETKGQLNEKKTEKNAQQLEESDVKYQIEFIAFLLDLTRWSVLATSTVKTSPQAKEVFIFNKIFFLFNKPKITNLQAT